MLLVKFAAVKVLVIEAALRGDFDGLVLCLVGVDGLDLSDGLGRQVGVRALCAGEGDLVRQNHSLLLQNGTERA